MTLVNFFLHYYPVLPVVLASTSTGTSVLSLLCSVLGEVGEPVKCHCQYWLALVRTSTSTGTGTSTSTDCWFHHL
jgi:hypothetical protein